jgi:hypothetical protein
VSTGPGLANWQQMEYREVRQLLKDKKR